ncbi:MAG: AbrB/MazE/SpoVT family DNA-binding domain-containing protein [Thermoanaerobacterales bacterium]|nr:AbrB/MazE/SpoVT family DNA-binding domain-containing protein [Thermoanaerobacterales bacterium]
MVIAVDEQFEVVKVTAKGQMTLPASVRNLLGIKQGDHLAVYVHGDELVLRKLAPLRKASDKDAIFRLIGRGEGPSDLAERHDVYLAEALEKETHK